MEVLSNLPCIHPLTTILGHDCQELRLEVFIGNKWTAGAFGFRFPSRFAGELSQFILQLRNDLAGVRKFELQFVNTLLIQCLHLFLEGFDLLLKRLLFIFCGWCCCCHSCGSISSLASKRQGRVQDIHWTKEDFSIHQSAIYPFFKSTTLMENESLNFYGYSERGMVNALCYDIHCSPDGLRLLQEFLCLCSFPFSKPDFDNVQTATFIVEQSFSDFGDLDLLILLDGSKKQAVLLEAKVKTTQASDWSIASQWAAFCDLPRAVAKTSNLFMQLYRKMRLICRIRLPKEALEPNERIPKERMGHNPVVAAAVEQLGKYCSETWYVSLIPDSKADAQRFFELELPKPTELPGWNHGTMGFLTWGELEKHLLKRPEDWPQTLRNFEYNKGQIYGADGLRAEQSPPPPGSLVTWSVGSEKRSGVIKNRGRRNTRVVLPDGTTEKVSNQLLVAVVGQPS